jgi:hypothetical protein
VVSCIKTKASTETALCYRAKRHTPFAHLQLAVLQKAHVEQPTHLLPTTTAVSLRAPSLLPRSIQFARIIIPVPPSPQSFLYPSSVSNKCCGSLSCVPFPAKTDWKLAGNCTQVRHSLVIGKRVRQRLDFLVDWNTSCDGCIFHTTLHIPIRAE